jgi:hypothetical protein
MPDVNVPGAPDYVAEKPQSSEKELVAQAIRDWNLQLERDPFGAQETADAWLRDARKAEFADAPEQVRMVHKGPLADAAAFLKATHDPTAKGAPRTAARMSVNAGQDPDAPIKAQAQTEKGNSTVQAGDPSLLLQEPGNQQQRVLGYTKGGFQPTNNSRAAQTESKVMPPEWHDALRAFTDHSRSAAEGKAIGDSELARIQADAAAKRQSVLQEQAKGEQLALQQEDSARQAAEMRIQTALADYAAATPRAENYGTLFEGADSGKRIAGVLGSLLGIFGGAMSGQPNQFNKQLDSMLERRARAAEANARMKGQLVGAAENAYARLEQSFGNAGAARASLRAIYTEEAKAAIEQQAAELGISMENPRLQAALAGVEEKRLGYLKETAASVMESARADERYVPPQAIMSAVTTGTGGMDAGLTKEQLEDQRQFGKVLREEGIPAAQAAVSLMKEASDEIGNDSVFWAAVAAANPETVGQLYSRFGADPKRQKFVSAYNDFLASRSGKAVTNSEGARLSVMLGDGSPAARAAAIQIMNQGVQTQVRTLQENGWDEQSQRWQRHKAYNDSRGRSGLDIRNIPAPQSVTEPPPVMRK